MKNLTPVLFVLLVMFSGCSGNSEGDHSSVEDKQPYAYALVLHGGAGTMTMESMPEGAREMFEAALDSALQIGLDLLEGGSPSIEAVEAVIRYMEDNPLFNAGRGAVFTSEGKNELDASIMTGEDLNAGAVAMVTDIRHPISAARAVMERSENVMLASNGASQFARESGLEMVDPSFFFSQRRYESFQRTLDKEKQGTVGCVALDRNGNLCAGTSTGGRTNKKYGRVGDSPIIGAGTYANNTTCGVSATGHGEYFIRWCVAHDISVLMEYRGLDVKAAAEEVVMGKLVEAGGTGGVVCLDSYGNPAMVHNTRGMFRAYGNSDGERLVAIFGDEEN